VTETGAFGGKEAIPPPRRSEPLPVSNVPQDEGHPDPIEQP
jgi:hypothetical protein